MAKTSFIQIDSCNIDDQEIKIVRDDIYPFIGGGVKARKAVYYEQYMKDNGFNACVTTGGIQSNHNRAIALMCAKNGWNCHIVYHGSHDRFLAEKGNALLVRNTNASYDFVTPDKISDTMDKAMNEMVRKGLNPLYIHGGGHDIPGGLALIDAVAMLKNECSKISFKPKYIFHASGTGSTQAGIAVGLDLVGWNEVKLIGISVARDYERGCKIIEDFATMLSKYIGSYKNYTGKINFNTDYIFGGYENCPSEMATLINQISRTTGIMFDHTYSGKALFGMHKYIINSNIEGPILFWHTGGLMNLLS